MVKVYTSLHQIHKISICTGTVYTHQNLAVRTDRHLKVIVQESTIHQQDDETIDPSVDIAQ